MIRLGLIVCVLLGVVFPAHSQVSGAKKESSLRLLLSEVQPGSMSSEHYCMLVFSDHRFHAEKASRSGGKDRERTAYEGELSDADWSALDGILDSQDFRKLNVPQGYVPLAVRDVHAFTISVRRENGFQNMEFIDDNSRKPYDSQLKPLLHWWKATRSRRMGPSKAPADSRCVLDSSHGIVSF